MEVGVFVMNSGQRRQVDNRGASRSVSLCQIGLRWLSERRNLGFLPPLSEPAKEYSIHSASLDGDE